MPPAILSLTESQQFTALAAFLVSVTGLPEGDVIQGQINRVPEPLDADFVVFWPLSQDRLGTNNTTYEDNVCVASIAGTVMTVTEMIQGTLAPGETLLDGTASLIAVNTILGQQLTGSLGGTGTYSVLPSQSLSSGSIFAGVRNDLVAVEWHVQLDVHGPNSANNARRIESLFRSEAGISAIQASGYDVTPLYADNINQVPFQNDQQQFENRWTMDLCFQLNPIVGTPQQFATEVVVDQVPVDLSYEP